MNTVSSWLGIKNPKCSINSETPHMTLSLRADLGILGGMGPAATANFMMKFAVATQATRDQEHFSSIVYSDPSTPDRSDAILGVGEDPLPAMLRGISFLNDARVRAVVIPCNTAHYWYTHLSRQSVAPILHIVDAVAAQIAEQAPEVRTIGVLATSGTIHAGLYDRLQTHGYERLMLDETEHLDTVMAGIRLVKAGELHEGRNLIISAANRLLERGADGVVFGCTDISAAIGEGNHDGIDGPSWDSALSLACTAVEYLRFRKDECDFPNRTINADRHH